MFNGCIGSRTWVRVWVWVNHQDLPQTKGLVMSKKNSRYVYEEFYFSLVDADGWEYQRFDPSNPQALDNSYEVSMDARNFDYQVFTIHSAVRELTKFVKHHGNFTLGKDFFIKSILCFVFDNNLGGHTDLSQDELEKLKALINPKLIWVDTKI